ncbi:MAG: peptidylprolyl isomerase [Thermoprotei archaeon]|nr:MAG: peptidylprolyl isomerase [Thermoprotei archaeon]
MPIKDGDFVLVNYVMRIKDQNKVIDTNIREEAEKAGIFDEKTRYEPLLVIIGEGILLKSLEEKLKGLEKGDEKEIELSPAEAFGTRDPNKIKVYSAKEFSMRGIIPRPGLEVEVGGRRGTVISVGGGRVIVDFNHPLAGKTLMYSVKILDILEDEERKIVELFHRWVGGIPKEEIEVTKEDSVLTLKLPETLFFIDRVGLLIRGFQRDISKYIPSIDTIRFIETITLKKKEKEKKEVSEELQPQQEQAAGHEDKE